MPNLSSFGPGDEITWGAPTGNALDPRTDDDDLPHGMIAFETAQEMAAEQISSTPGLVADWLSEMAADLTLRKPVETMKIDEADIQGAPAHVLLALIMTGTDKQAGLARMFLRDRFEADYAECIDERANEILIEINGKPDDTPAGYRETWDD